MPKDDTPPLQLIVVEGGGYCDPVTGLCEPTGDPAAPDAPDAEPAAEETGLEHA